MNTTSRIIAALITGGVLVLGGCATAPYGYYGAPPPTVAPSVQYGVVEGIDIFRSDGSGPIGVGALLGGIAGGVIGHQIGSGTGTTVATIAGAVGGAVVGSQIESKQRVEGSRYRITVRTDAGYLLQLDNSNDLNLRVGDRVRVENNRVYRM